MNRITKTTAGSQTALFQDVVAVLPGGVNLIATERYADYIPAGVAVVKNNDGTYKVATEVADIQNAVGLTLEDVKVEDFTLVSIVISGTARTSVLPELELANAAELKKVLTRITLV